MAASSRDFLFLNEKENKMKDCSINLKECETFCNEKQIYPAMKYFVQELKMSVRAASREVRKLTKHKVTDGRAAKVYSDRTPPSATNVAPPPPDTEEIEENQDVNNESDSVETSCVDYDDVENPEPEPEPDKTKKKPKKKGGTNTKINKEQIFTESFQNAHKALFEEIQRAKMDGWKNVSKEAVYYHIDLLMSLTEV